jgi:predicted phage tail protein
MKVKIHVHGALREHLPAVWECDAATAAEAISGLTRQFKLRAPGPGRRWALKVPGFDTEASLKSPLAVDELHLVPYFGGSGGKGGGIFQVVIGVVLIVLAAVAAYYGNFQLAAALAAAGVSSLAGGLVALMSAAPKVEPNTNEEIEDSKYLGAAGNTTKSGTRIPRGFGRFLVYGHYISFDIEADPAPVLGQPPRADQRRLLGTYRVTT